MDALYQTRLDAKRNWQRTHFVIDFVINFQDEFPVSQPSMEFLVANQTDRTKDHYVD